MRNALTLNAALGTLAVLGALAAASARVAAADPAEARVLTAPTAWLPPAGAITGAAAVDQKGDGSVLAGYGLGGLAAVELGADTEIHTCTRCDDPADARWLPRAQFRLGARQDAWFRGMPALLVGVKTTFAARGSGGFVRPRVTEGYVVASRVIGPVKLHGGVEVIAAGFADFELAPVLRPIAAIEITPPRYPRSTFLGDVGWVTRLELPGAGEPDEGTPGATLELMGGFGARYQAFRWGSIELGVRVPQEEGMSGSRVMMRLTGVWDPDAGKRRR